MIQFKKQLVTPELAKEWLGKNTNNRKVKTKKIRQYADDILLGLWKEDTGETIKFSKCGKLIDGQNRLKAISLANKPIYLHISSGHELEVFSVLDTGAIRNANDIFTIQGTPYSSNLPSVINFYLYLKSGAKSTKQNNVNSNTIVLDLYLKNTEYWLEVMRNSNNFYTNFNHILTKSHIGGMYAYLCDFNPQYAFLFMEQFTYGIDISNQTISILRNQLTKDKLAMRKMNAQTKMGLIVKTYNAFVSGKEIKNLKYNPNVEPFPTPLSL